MVRKLKGSVSVEVVNGWLRIRFRYQGKRQAFAVGLPDSKVNWAIAESKANQIELDIKSGNFDPTLKKYRPPRVGPDYVEGRLTVPALFEDFIKFKAKHVTSKTLEKYQSTHNYLKKFFSAKPVDFLGLGDAEKFIEGQKHCSHPT